MMRNDAWNPARYGKFAGERARPFEDLLALVEPVPGGVAVDLGCGTGELTARLHAHLGASRTVGIDSSAAMLERARPTAGAGLTFLPGDIGRLGEIGQLGELDGRGAFDVVFSNAALHWVPDHPSLLRRLRDALRPGGQLAVQVPANGDHPSHALAFEIAGESPFGDALRDAARDGHDPLPAGEATPVLAPERYAALLERLGFADQHVRLQVYGHHLASTADVVEWTRGTTLTRFERGLSPELYEQFVDRYRRRLLDVLGEHSPYFYTFKRVLFRARLADIDTDRETR
jgi:trans-aconitate 2-methyltransferase